MYKKMLLSFTLILSIQSLNAMENNNSTNPVEKDKSVSEQFHQPGEEAIKNHPYLWHGNQLTSGGIGGAAGFVAFVLAAMGAEYITGQDIKLYDKVPCGEQGCKLTKTKLRPLRVLSSAVISMPFIYGGFLTGQSFSEFSWKSVWYAIKKSDDWYKKIKNN